MKQKPSAGEKVVPKDTVIELTYSTGPPTATVPDLTNLSKDEATVQLKNKGLDPQFTEGDYSEDVEKDHVIKQDPAKGAEVQTGTLVTVYLSKGAKPKPVKTTEDITVPVDQTQENPDNKNQPLTKHVQIFYSDANHSNEKFKDETIAETKKYLLDLTIDPNSEASYKVVVDDKTIEEKTIKYEDINQ
jgi:serine/threonine-protein kinase